jgi:predicted metalloendopeptidase
MTLPRIGALAILIAIAVVFPAAQTTPPVVPGLDTKGMDLSVRPQDDFFRYVNGKWADGTPIPSDLPTYGSFIALRDRSQEAVRGIVEGEAAKSAPRGSMAQKIGDYYTSFTDEARVESLGAQPLAREFEAIDAIASRRDLPKAFARAARLGVRAPLSVGVTQDPRKSDLYTVAVQQAGLGMPDRDYYLRDDERFAGIRKAYVGYITQLLTLAKRPDPAGAAARILALETTIAKAQWDRARSRDRDLTYNKRTRAELQAATPQFDWSAYFKQVKSPGVKEVIVRQPDYLTAVNGLLADTPIATWKEYFSFGLLTAYADALSSPFANAAFEFNGKIIGGRQEMQPRWKRAVASVEDALGEPVGKLYVERYFKPEAKARMDALIRNLQAAFKVSIDELEWMSPETKRQAQAKLAMYTLKIGYPDKWRDFSSLEVRPGDLVGNMMRSREFEMADNWNRLGRPVERWRWNFTAQTVNASYSPSNNEITFPAGILQPPFFNVDADDAINYGAIGSVIGHEISHGFDDQGRKSDGAGNLRDWWTADDAKRFEERAAKLGAQFESYAPLPGMKINGRQTMGENIGDLSGIAVAYRAYKMSLQGKPSPVIGGFTGEQRFFLGYAQVWRFKSRDEALRNQLLTDAHSPGMFRAFVPLTNIDAFYEAFGLKPGDKLYRAPAERVKIW